MNSGAKQTPPKVQYQFKKIEKIVPTKLEYNPFEYKVSETVYLSLDKRPFTSTTLEQELENHLSIRMRSIIPAEIDLTDYDKELLTKNLDIETLEVTIT